MEGNDGGGKEGDGGEGNDGGEKEGKGMMEGRRRGRE